MQCLFSAAATSTAHPLGFYPLQNCCQLFGLDFLVDTDINVHLLEVNSDPSLQIFGDRLGRECAAMLHDVARLALRTVQAVQGIAQRAVDSSGVSAARECALATFETSSVCSRTRPSNASLQPRHDTLSRGEEQDPIRIATESSGRSAALGHETSPLEHADANVDQVGSFKMVLSIDTLGSYETRRRRISAVLNQCGVLSLHMAGTAAQQHECPSASALLSEVS